MGHLLDVCLRRSPVAEVTEAVGRHGFGDGGLAARTERVTGAPGRGFLFGTGLDLDLLEFAGQQDGMAPLAVDVAGAGGPIHTRSRQAARGKRTERPGWPSRRIAFHGGLVTPRGQVAVCWSQSMLKSCLSKPGRRRRGEISRTGPSTVTP
jgi:hypothetical protein